MKIMAIKVFTLIIFVFSQISISGQINNLCSKSTNIKSEKGLIKSVEKPTTKTFGDVYWSEDFDGANWSSTVEEWGLGYQLNPTATLPTHEDGGTWNFVDNLGRNYFWHWSDVGTRGAYSRGTDDDCHTPDPLTITCLPEGTSTENGFMLFEADYFNSTASCVISSNFQKHNSYMMYGPIDFSDKPGAIFKVKTYYRHCCNSDSRLVVQFSTDYDMEADTGTWGDEYQLNNETPTNSYTYTNERDFSANVSAEVVGQSNVYFKISIINCSHYFAYIDDIKFIEPPVNDLVITDNWALYMLDTEDPEYSYWDIAKYNFYGGYTQIPVSLAQPFVKFKAAVTNNGLTDAVNAKASVKFYKDGILDLTTSGDPITVDKYKKDTLRVVSDYTPSDTASYQVSMTVTMDAEDQDQSNNNWVYNFEVGKNVYSRVHHGQEENFVSAGPRNWADGGYDGDMIAQLYDVPEGTSVLLKGLSTYISNYRGRNEEIAAIEAGEFAMIGKVFYNDLETGQVVNTGIATEIYIVQIDDTATWVTLDFVDEGNLELEGGEKLQYYMTIETYTGTEQVLRFEVGTDISVKQPYNNGGLLYLKNKDNWIVTGDNYAIDMIIDTDKHTFLNINICEGEFYTFGDFVLTESGQYIETISLENYIDSIIILSLNVNPTYDISSEIEICLGDTYLFGGEELNQSGEYSHSFISITGCDSTVNLTL
ncbi:MAG: hypothetical protein JEZ09_12860, partial [Salinivirgaceae bacterium]|nr:hypothetical protein [Salinivirgaceae bacterium]